MGVKRSSGSARVEEQLVLEWKCYAARRARSADRVAAGACYLEPRPCPFEASVILQGSRSGEPVDEKEPSSEHVAERCQCSCRQGPQCWRGGSETSADQLGQADDPSLEWRLAG